MLGKRLAIVQHHLDHIETGWRVGTIQADGDADVIILENADRKKTAYAFLPEKWFDGGMQSYIEWEIRRALNDTEVK